MRAVRLSMVYSKGSDRLVNAGRELVCLAEPKFFATAAEWRHWLETYHTSERELLVGFYKKNSGQASITWPESVDEALCFGWIDGVRRRIDEVSYSIRFTPRKPGSIWSAVNTKRAGELKKLGLMAAAGVKAFQARREDRSRIYAFEQEQIQFDRQQEGEFREQEAAWTFFMAQPAWYKRTATWWVISAKREETRKKRLAILMEDSARGRTIRTLTPTQERRRDD